MAPRVPQYDAYVENHGSLCLVRLMTRAAAVWVRDHVQDDAQFFGEALVVEPRYVVNLVDGMVADGLRVY